MSSDVQRYHSDSNDHHKDSLGAWVKFDDYDALTREVEGLTHRINDAESLLKRCVECVNSAKYAAILHGTKNDEERIQTLIHDFQCYIEEGHDNAVS